MQNDRNSHRRTRSFLSVAVLVAIAGVSALMLLPPLVGYERYVITGGSMTGSLDRGSVAFEETVAVHELRVGDVITYQPPARAGVEGNVTHRIARISRDRSGRRVFRTKGDANATADPWRFTLDQAAQARVAGHVPYLGFFFMALEIRLVRMLVIGLPALLVALSALAGLWREAGAEQRREGRGAEVAA